MNKNLLTVAKYATVPFSNYRGFLDSSTLKHTLKLVPKWNALAERRLLISQLPLPYVQAPNGRNVMSFEYLHGLTTLVLYSDPHRPLLVLTRNDAIDHGNEIL